jgi:hypothetical protein
LNDGTQRDRLRGTKDAYHPDTPARDKGCDGINWNSNGRGAEDAPVKEQDGEFRETDGKSVKNLDDEEIQEEIPHSRIPRDVYMLAQSPRYP